MANFEERPAASNFSITPDLRVAAPFTPSNLTWVEVDASTAAAWASFYVMIFSSTGGNSNAGIFFVGVGAASSEVIIASMPLAAGFRNTCFNMPIPIPIASGSRVSVAVSRESVGVVTGQVIGLPSADFDAEPAFTVFESGPYDLTSSADYGKWPEVDPGATSNTKGAYAEISFTSHTNNVLNGDSLANTYDWFGYSMNANFNTVMSGNTGFMDVATGAAASEVIFAKDISARYSTLEISPFHVPLITHTGVATSGTRVSARMESNSTNDPDRKRGVLLFGAR